MKTLSLLAASFAAAVLGVLSAPAGDLLQVKIQATGFTTNDAGEPVKIKIDNQSLLQDFADQNGVTNMRTIALVYHVDGDERGDAIQVVDAQTAAILSDELGLFFPVEIPLKADGSQIERMTGVYNDQQPFSVGSTVLKEKISFNPDGSTNRSISGNLQYYSNPQGTNGLRLFIGTLTANKLFVTNSLPPPKTNKPPHTPGGTNSVAGSGQTL